MPTPDPSRRALFVVLLGSLAMVAVTLRPLGEAILVGAVMAAVLWPLQVRLTRLLGGRPSAAAAILVLGLVLVVVGPVTAMLAYAVRQTFDAVDFLTATLQSRGAEGLLHDLPAGLQSALRHGLGAGPADPLAPLLAARAGALGGAATSALSSAATATGALAYHTVMMLIATYLFLTKKEAAIAWIDDVSPLREDQTVELLGEVHVVSTSIVRTAVLTAGVQAAAALVGYLIVGVPSALFFTAFTFFFAMVPAVGGAAGTLATAALVFVSGRTGAALFLVAWALLVVGLVDNVAKPLLLRHDVQLDGILILFSLLGGLAAFGAVGLILGPLSVAFFLAVLRIWRRDYGDAPPFDDGSD